MTTSRNKTSVAAAVIAMLPAALGASGFDEPDVDTARCLEKGKILRETRTTLEGITSPELYTILCEGGERRVVVKSLHIFVQGLSRFRKGTGTPKMNFSDSYRYERAAYLLDRLLGLDMVPVVVLRHIGGRERGVVEFIEGASFVPTSPHTPSDRERAHFARQKAIMDLFDALIYNSDRNDRNQLVDDENWRLYLIDHSRAFRHMSDLPDEGWVNSRAEVSRVLYERLENLEKAHLVKLLDGLISKAQIRALLARRDKIIEKIDEDRRVTRDPPVSEVSSAEPATGPS